MDSTRPDELSISGEGVASVCLNAVSPLGVLVNDVPMSVPDLGDWVLNDDPIAELKFRARELGPVFLDLFRIFEPLLHVNGKLRV